MVPAQSSSPHQATLWPLQRGSCRDVQENKFACTGGAPKVEDAQKAAGDAASAAKSALPDQPQQAAKDAASAAKDALPEPPKDVPNPFQGFFGGAPTFMLLVWPASAGQSHKQLCG